MKTTANNPPGLFWEQAFPIALTAVVFAVLAALVFFVIRFTNQFYPSNAITLSLRPGDIAVGAGIYLKTAVDFAIFMGLLMAVNPGWKNRVAIEFGTAVGNALGTILILILWITFKELHILLALMIILAALILFQLAAESLEQIANWEGENGFKKTLFLILRKFLNAVLAAVGPLTSRLLPDLSAGLNGDRPRPWKKLLLFSLSVPLILGLDDFAGYVPLFSAVNVFGFSVGVLGAHMLLNIALFLSPSQTIEWVRNQWVAFLGSAAFVGLALWGLFEAVRILV